MTTSSADHDADAPVADAPRSGPAPEPTAAEATELRPWLEAVAAITVAVNRPAPLPEVLDLVAETAARLLGYDFCAVLLADPGGRSLVITGWHGLSASYVRQVNAEHPVVLDPDDPHQAPSSKAFLTGTSVQVGDTVADSGFLPWGGVAREQGYRSMISVPVTSSGAPVGTLNCYTRLPRVFGAAEQDLLGLLADQAGVAIETARLRDHQEATIAELTDANTALADQHAVMRRDEEIHRQLTEVALHGGGVAGVARALAGLLATDVAVVEEPARTELARAGDAPAPVEEPAGTSTPVVLGQDVVARIWVPRTDPARRPLHVRALEHAATVCALEILRSQTALEVEWRHSGEVVRDLLTGDPAGLGGVEERAGRLGHDLSLPHVVLVVRLADGGGRGARALSVARSFAATAQPRALVGTLADDVALLWPVVGAEDPTDRAEELRRLLVRVGSVSAACLGVGRACTRASDYAAEFRRARGAVTLAVARGRHEVVTAQSLGVLGLLVQLEDATELRRFATDLLAPLRRHDGATDGVLEETLRAYLAHDLNTAATAAALFVHPNTVGLRIRKIERLLDVSVGDVRTLTELHVALHVDEVARAGAAGDASRPSR